jgi:hypothetical protein
MPFVLEETTSQNIDREHVERRVADWADRINALYNEIADWLPAGWTAKHSGSVQMHEELMRQFDVPARNLPILLLSSTDGRSGRIEPRVLWIIGANGRLDLFVGANHYLIVDAAENFQPPLWRIAPFSDRRQLRPLDAGTFGAAL